MLGNKKVNPKSNARQMAKLVTKRERHKLGRKERKCLK